MIAKVSVAISLGEYKQIEAGLRTGKQPAKRKDDPVLDDTHGFFSMEIAGENPILKDPDGIEPVQGGLEIFSAPYRAFIPYSQVRWVMFDPIVEGWGE